MNQSINQSINQSKPFHTITIKSSKHVTRRRVQGYVDSRTDAISQITPSVRLRGGSNAEWLLESMGHGEACPVAGDRTL